MPGAADILSLNPVTAGAQAGTQLLGNVVNLVGGISKTSRAKKLEASLVNDPREDYEIPQEYEDSYRVAESRASEGLSEGSKQTYRQSAERGLSASINAILESGGNANNIADLYQKYDSGISTLGLIDEQLRANNVKQYIDEAHTMGDQQDKRWQIRTYAPWADKKQEAAALRQEGAEQIAGAVSGAAQSVGNYFGSNAFPGLGQQKTAKNKYPGLNGSWTPIYSNNIEPVSENTTSQTVEPKDMRGPQLEIKTPSRPMPSQWPYIPG